MKKTSLSMFRIKILSTAITLAIFVLPASAQGLPPLTQENIGKGVGAVAGALIGSQIGGGRGQLAAVAIGTLAGYWVGGNVGRHLSQTDRSGIAQTTSRAINSGQNTSWQNPDTGMKTSVSVQDVNQPGTQNLKQAVSPLPAIELSNAFYEPKSNVNVRGGPGTDYQIVHSIAKGQSVPVIGRVIDSDWYLIADQGIAAGFIYAPLLHRTGHQDASINAIRQAMKTEQPGRYVAGDQRCRVITQRVELNNGVAESYQFRACQQANGNWVKV